MKTTRPYIKKLHFITKSLNVQGTHINACYVNSQSKDGYGNVISKLII
jgi:hypothetical protein